MIEYVVNTSYRSIEKDDSLDELVTDIKRLQSLLGDDNRIIVKIKPAYPITLAVPALDEEDDSS